MIASPGMPIARPTVAFLLRHPAHLIALGCGAGLAPVAPGTVGTLVAWPIAWLLDSYANTLGWLATIVAVAIVGAWAAGITARDLGVADHGSIVIDEIAAFLLVLFFAAADPARQALAFVLFRFFDVVKPPPIRQVDRAMKGGIGVMADDFLAAGYTLLVLAIVQRVIRW
jgi:phosphatidylglycerophosphatase A